MFPLPPRPYKSHCEFRKLLLILNNIMGKLKLRTYWATYIAQRDEEVKQEARKVRESTFSSVSCIVG